MTSISRRLQEFAVQVSYVCNLETGGKVSPQEAYLQLETLLADFDGFVAHLGYSPPKENQW
jgi:hypothetical protein